MTAVEQLIDQLTSIGVLEIPQGSNAVTSIIEQAKEMEEEQMIQFADEYSQAVMGGCLLTPTEFYNETFKTE